MSIIDMILDDDNISKDFKKALKDESNNQEIKVPTYYYEDEETNEKHYDFEEMANELENRICEKLNVNVSITISEVE